MTATRKDLILDFIREHPGATQESICAAFPKLSAPATLLTQLTMDGFVRREKIRRVSKRAGHRYEVFRYYVKEKSEMMEDE